MYKEAVLIRVEDGFLYGPISKSLGIILVVYPLNGTIVVGTALGTFTRIIIDSMW